MTERPDRYGNDVLASDPHLASRVVVRQVPVTRGLVVEEVETGWVGSAVRVEKSAGVYLVELEDRFGKIRSFPLGPGFWIDGRPVVLLPPQAASAAAGRQPARTASGSTAVANHRAQVARPSRLWVEGRHDGELIEKIWGDDLRIEGVVVEILDGVDHLAARLDEFAPTRQARAGVLVDHLVRGSKEQRLIAGLAGRYPDGSVLVVGHPYVDVWQSVRPERLGLAAWPVIPREVEWKRGVLEHLGWPHAEVADVAAGWQRILAAVRTYRDLEPELLAKVEELIDFVTAPVETTV